VGKNGERWGAREEGDKMMDVTEMNLSSLLEQHTDTSVKQQIIHFCTRHPRMKFVPECILSDHKTDKDTLDKQIQALVDQGIIARQTSKVGTVWYHLNGIRQELVES